MTPFVYEARFGSAITKRTELAVHAVRGTGPPDLVHVGTSKAGRDNGRFQYVTGIDVSLTAAPVAYMTRLVTGLERPNAVGTYCSWNCFSKCDVRVRSEFPGQRTAVQAVDLRGRPFVHRESLASPGVFSEEVWAETYVLGVLRSVLFSDSLEHYRIGLVQNSMFPTASSVKRAVIEMLKLLPKGQLVGALELHQGADFVHNYLVDALEKLVSVCGLYEFAINELDKLIEKDFLYHTVLVRLLVTQNTNEKRLLAELAKGVEHFGKSEDRKYTDFYLLAQSKLLCNKNDLENGLYLATKAVEHNPTEFLNWTNLLEVYITKRDVQNALLTLNLCPVYLLPSAKTVQRIREENLLVDTKSVNFELPEPSREGYLDDVWTQASRAGPVYLKDKDTILSEDFALEIELSTVDPILLRLSGPKLKGTFKVAYNHLLSLAVLVGWDALLKIRAQVFVMEGEIQKIEKDLDKEFKTKRLCERWLDSLFFMLYDDLKVVSLWEAKAKKSGNALSHSTLEWELIGITALRAKHYDLAILALRTSMKAKFSIILAKALLEIFEQFYLDYQRFKRLNLNLEDNRYAKELLFVGLNNVLFPPKKEFSVASDRANETVAEQIKSIELQSLENSLYLNLILEVLIKVFLWNYRWYEDFSIDSLLFLKEILRANGRDLIINRLKAGFEEQGSGVRMVERYAGWLEAIGA